MGYAIGEIALIIIGIMIALQLNNWNEDRKAQGEFEVYIDQLKEDVRGAIKNVNAIISQMENFAAGSEFVLSFLAHSEYEPEELADFETGLNHLGNYGEAQVYVGLLGDLMNGNRDIIGRDRALALKALEMESQVEQQLNNLDHIYNRIDLAGRRLDPFLGRGKNVGERPPKYDLEELKSSDEFINTSYGIISDKMRIVSFSGEIVEELESFLTVLEEYE